MLTAVQHRLDDFCFILASASPRRLKLLEELTGLKGRITTIPSKFDENLDATSFNNAADYAIATSLEKALEVASRPEPSFSDRHILISADTVIESNGRVLGKPANPTESRAMLRELSGHCHLVHTGVTLGLFDASALSKYDGRCAVKTHPLRDTSRLLNTLTFSVTTRVNFCSLDDDVINGYVATGEGLDKAGSYGIQALGSTLVESIDGDFYNVVGLPITRLCQEIYSVVSKK